MKRLMARAGRIELVLGLLTGLLAGHPPLARAAQSVGPFSPAEQGVTLGLGALALTFPSLVTAPEESRWSGPLPLEGAVSGWIGAETRAGARRASIWSDWALTVLVGVSVVATGESGAQGRWQAAQSYAVTGIASSSLKALVGRARPYVDQCRDNPLGADCFSEYRNESFVSGHTAFAFTGAGLVCAMRPGPALDDALCPIAVTLASATGLLRVAMRNHHLSDILAGAALGWLSGHALPRWRRADRMGGAPAVLTLQLAF